MGEVTSTPWDLVKPDRDEWHTLATIAGYCIAQIASTPNLRRACENAQTGNPNSGATQASSRCPRRLNHAQSKTFSAFPDGVRRWDLTSHRLLECLARFASLLRLTDGKVPPSPVGQGLLGSSQARAALASIGASTAADASICSEIG